MAYKTILVHLDTDAQCAARVERGIDLALAFDAHLVGLAVAAPLIIPGTVHPEVVVRMLSEDWERSKLQLREIGAEFCGRARVRGVFKVEARMEIGEPAVTVSLHARYADLLVVGQPSPDGEGIAEHVVLQAGRPVLVLPYSAAASGLGRRVMVAWNASREATRALTDALPLLARADQVDVVTVNAQPAPRGHGEIPGADIAMYLSRHDVRANVLATAGEDVDVGEWLLSRACDLGSDLIVMGAYGHSRMRELVLGGATRTLLGSMTVPVIMSH